MPRPRCTGPRCFFTHAEFSKNSHEAVLQALNRWMVFKNHQTGVDEQYFYATDNFEGTESQWDVSPLIFAQSHPNPSLVKKDLGAALKSVKTIDGNDGYICGSVVKSKVVIPGQPRLAANIVFDDPALETMYNEGKLALSSAFFCPNEPDGRLNGKVEPNHVLVFVQDDKNQPRDLGSGWWHNQSDKEDGNVVDSKMHGGPGSGRYPAGSGNQEVESPSPRGFRKAEEREKFTDAAKNPHTKEIITSLKDKEQENFKNSPSNFDSHFTAGKLNALTELEKELPSSQQLSYLTRKLVDTEKEIKSESSKGKLSENMSAFYSGRARQFIELGAMTSRDLSPSSLGDNWQDKQAAWIIRQEVDDPAKHADIAGRMAGFTDKKSMTHGGLGSGRYPAGSGGSQSIGGPVEISKEEFERKIATMKSVPKDKATEIKNDMSSSLMTELESFGQPATDVIDAIETSVSKVDGSWESGGARELGYSTGYDVASILIDEDVIGNDASETETQSSALASHFSSAVAEMSRAGGSRAYDILGSEAKVGFVEGYSKAVKEILSDDEDEMENKEANDVSDIEKFKSFVNKLWHKLTGDVDDSSRIDDERPPVNDQPIHSHNEGGDGMDPAIQKKIDDLDAKVTALQTERNTLVKTNKALEDEKADLSKTNKEMQESIEKIALEKEDKAWANLRDTKIPRGWLVGDKAEDTQRAEYKKDPVAYLNKIIEAKRENPKEEVGMPFTNQGGDGDDIAQMNTLLVKSNIPGRLH